MHYNLKPTINNRLLEKLLSFYFLLLTCLINLKPNSSSTFWGEALPRSDY